MKQCTYIRDGDASSFVHLLSHYLDTV